MQTTVHEALHNAILTLMRPLARILIRNGLAFGAFTEIAKKVFVDVAFEEFAEDGRKQTISRVSAMTGLTRKETKRLYELENNTVNEACERYNRAIRVISGWVNDKRYQSKQGGQKILPVTGNSVSFTSLVKEYSGDIPTQAMLAVLKKAGSVIENEKGIELVSHAFVPGDDPVDKLNILGTDAAELIATIDHNLTNPPDQLLYQRKVSNTNIDPEAIEAFRELSARKAQALLESLDAWLIDHELTDSPDNNSGDGQYASLGIYYSEHKTPKE